MEQEQHDEQIPEQHQNGQMIQQSHEQHETSTPEPLPLYHEEGTGAGREQHQDAAHNSIDFSLLTIADYPGLLPNTVRWKPGAVVIRRGLPLDLPYWMLVVEVNDPARIVIGQLPCVWFSTWYPRADGAGRPIDPYEPVMLPIGTLYHPSSFGCRFTADTYDEYIMSQQRQKTV